MSTSNGLVPRTPLIDPFRRSIDYLRVSVTDRCNLRCVYCMPEEGVPSVSHQEVLTLEEIGRIIRVGAGMGLRRVRLTGGEPLVRKGVVELVRWVSQTPGIEDISLTTNAILLPSYARDLAAAGLKRVNVSLDTLRPQRFRDITRRGDLSDVMAGIAAARQAGLSPTKLNVVVMRGINDDEVVEIASTTLEEDWQVRFIELMPFMDEQETCIRDTPRALGFIPSRKVKRQVEEALGSLEVAEPTAGGGPAKYYRLPGARGLIGFISPLSEGQFCAICNRMRLTADGKIRPCLLTDQETDLKQPLREGGSDDHLRQRILEALHSKPDAHHLSDGNRPRRRKMAQIGG
jgi:cyclic pyranopterin phosphate synthase